MDPYKTARSMRKAGKSLGEICKSLGRNKSTIFDWIRDIKLSKSQQQEVYDKSYLRGEKNPNWRGGKKRYLRTREEWKKYNAKNFSDKKSSAFKEGFNRAKMDPDFKNICLLYWAEGCKSGMSGNLLILSNSEREFIYLFSNWLVSEGLGSKRKLWLQIHEENGVSEKDILSHWGSLNLDRPIGITRIKNSRASKKIRKTLTYGTAQLQICDLRTKYMIFGGIEYLKSLSPFYTGSPSPINQYLPLLSSNQAIIPE